MKLLRAALAATSLLAGIVTASAVPQGTTPGPSASTAITPTGSTATLSLGDALAQAPNITSFANVKCDGTTDDSAAIKAAHDAVFAQGKRFLYFPRACYAPSIGLLNYQVGNVIFIGPGSLIGAYRKQVIPVTASAGVVSGEVNPAIHLKQFASQQSPVVVLTGDSKATYSPAPNLGSTQDTFDRLLYTQIANRNPDKTIQWYNRAIPGQGWTQLNGIIAAGTANLGSWYTAPGSATWISYICALAPDLVIIDLGTNDGAGIVATDFVAAVTKIQACTTGKTADVILVTTDARSGMYSTIVNPYDQNGRDFVSGLLRAYARKNGLGLIDVHRQYTLAVDGTDPDQVGMLDVVQTASQQAVTLPYVFPQTIVHDFDITAKFDNTSYAFFASGSNGSNRIQIKPIGGYLSSYLQVFDNSGLLSVVYVPGGGFSSTQVNSATATPNGTFNLHVAVRSNRILVDINGTIVFNLPLMIWGGGVVSSGGVWTPPTITQTTGTTATGFTVVHLGLGQPRPFMPTLTDQEYWGTTDALYAYGGNGINHATSLGMNLVQGPLLERTNFAAPPPNGYAATGIAAAGTTQATATALTVSRNDVTTVASGAGVLLQAMQTRPQEVFNSGANALLVYPPSGASIGAGSANAAVTLAAGGHGTFTCFSATLCRQGP